MTTQESEHTAEQPPFPVGFNARDPKQIYIAISALSRASLQVGYQELQLIVELRKDVIWKQIIKLSIIILKGGSWIEK